MGEWLKLVHKFFLSRTNFNVLTNFQLRVVCQKKGCKLLYNSTQYNGNIKSHSNTGKKLGQMYILKTALQGMLVYELKGSSQLPKKWFDNLLFQREYTLLH